MKYFAKEEANVLAAYLDQRLDDWSSQITKSGLKLKWQKLYQTYYGRHWKTGGSYQDNDIARMGVQGEINGLTINDFRNIIKHMLVLTTNQRITYEPRATNSDERSLTQTRLAKIIIDYYVREKRVSRFLHDCAELALVFGKGFIKVTWDKQGGRPYSVQPREDGSEGIVYEGDIRIKLKDPFQVFTDQLAEEWSDIDWVNDIEWVNRWDIIAQYPELEDKILGIKTKDQFDGLGYLQFQSQLPCDLIAVKEFYHRRTPSMPSGRYVRYLSENVILYDGAIPYSGIPIYRMVAGKWYGSTEGYSESFDLLNLQQAENILASAIFTNNSAFAIQNVLVPEGCNLNAFQLGGSLQALRYNPAAGKPEALQLTQSPPETFKMWEMISSKMETTMGLNSVARGNPDTEMSGKAMGLLQSMAIQYASAFQASFAETAEDVGTAILRMIKAFAKTERLATISGKFNQGEMVKFTGDDISEIERVVIDLQNPYMSTMAGRKETANELLSAGMIKTIQEYLTFIETGNAQILTQFDEAKLSLVHQENEWLQDGKPVMALQGEPHILHCQEHMALLSKPQIKMNSPVTENILMHVQQHIDLARTQDPFFGMISGEPPVPPPMPMMPPPPGEQPMEGPQQGQPMPVEPQQVPTPPGPEQALQESLQ